MCLLSNLYEDDVKEIYPNRVELLEKIQEKLWKSTQLAMKTRRNHLNCISGIIAPTGIGKTTYMVSLALASAIYGKNKVTVVTPTKESRAEILARILEGVTRIIKNNKQPPKILVLYSKIDTCINNHKKIREVLEQLREEEQKPNPDTNTINKLSKLFYSRCNQLVKTQKCPFYNNAHNKTLVNNIINTVISNNLVFIVGSITNETVKVIEREAPSYIEHSKDIGVELPYIVDIKSVAESVKVCPYELAKAMVEKVDIIVLDSTYLSSLMFRSNPIVATAFSGDRLVLIDETHELFRNTYPSIEISPKSPIYRIRAVRDIEKVMEKIMDKYEVPEARMDIANESVRIAVPPQKLDDDLVNLVMRALRNGLKELNNLTLTSRERLILESELSILYEAFKLEKYGYRVSEGVNPGILAFMQVTSEKETRYYVIPVIFSKKLKHGRDFETVVHFSATLLPTHLSLIHNAPRGFSEQVIEPVKWRVIEENRRTAILKIPSYIKYRGDIVGLMKEIIRTSGKKKVMIIATSTWGESIREMANELNYQYYTPKIVRTQGEREREANKIREIIHSDVPVILHISPHTSFGVAVNLAEKDKPLDTLVIGASESILPPTSEVNAEASVVSRKYGINWFLAWFTVNVNRAILKTVQTAGRLQRSEKHKVDLILIGRYFDRTLAKFYEPVFGKYNIIYDSDTINVPEIIKEVKEYFGW